MKEHVLTQLPPKRRQIVWVVLKAADILLATSSCSTSGTMVMDGESRKESFVDCFSDQDKDGDQKLEKYDACPGEIFLEYMDFFVFVSYLLFCMHLSA